MEIRRDLAIVLKSVQFEERHKIITAMTENHGLISAIAKNSVHSRRFGGAIDLFTASTWTFTQKPTSDLVHLSQAEPKLAFENIRMDFEKLSLASLLSEFLTKAAPQQEPCPELFRLHSNTLFALHSDHEVMERTEAKVVLLNTYLSKLLQWNGNQPRLKECAQCLSSLDFFEKSAELSCLIDDPGWICPPCRTQGTRHIQTMRSEFYPHPQKLKNAFLRVSRAALEDFQLSLTLPIRQVLHQSKASLKEHQELFKWIEALCIYHLPGLDRSPPKSLRFLGLESNLPPAPAYPQ